MKRLWFALGLTAVLLLLSSIFIHFAISDDPPLDAKQTAASPVELKKLQAASPPAKGRLLKRRQALHLLKKGLPRRDFTNSFGSRVQEQAAFEKDEAASCRATLIDFASQPLEQQYTSYLDLRSGDCAGHFPQALAADVRDNLVRCAEKGMNAWSDREQETCLLAFIRLRAMLVDELISDNADFESLAHETVLNKIFAKFIVLADSGTALPKSTLHQAVKMIDILLAEAPELTELHKAKIIFLLSDYWGTAASTKVAQVEEALDVALQSDPEDEELWSAQAMLLATAEREAEFADLVDEMISKYPDRGYAHYLQARLHWRNGDKQAAIQSLEKAVSLAPEKADFAETLAEARSVNVGSKIFRFNMHFSMTSLLKPD